MNYICPGCRRQLLVKFTGNAYINGINCPAEETRCESCGKAYTFRIVPVIMVDEMIVENGNRLAQTIDEFQGDTADWPQGLDVTIMCRQGE